MNFLKDSSHKILPDFLGFNPFQYNIFPTTSYHIIDDLNIPSKNYCPICLKLKINFVKPDSCFHAFCSKCLYQWSTKKKTCPICRKAFNTIIKFE